MDPLDAPEPYRDAREHLDDYMELVRLLLGRHIVRHWHRMVDSAGDLSDVFVSLIETRFVLRGEPTQRRPPDVVGTLSDAQSAEALEGRRQLMLERLGGATDASIFPIENLRAHFELTPRALDVVMVLAALQLNLDLARLATFAWADFSVKQPTLGFVAELVSDTAAERRQVLQLAEASSVLRQLRLIDFAGAEEGGTPSIHLRLRLPDRVVAYLSGRDLEPEVTGHLTSHNELDTFAHLSGSAKTLDELGYGDPLRGRFDVACRLAIRSAARRPGGEASAPAVELVGLAPAAIEDIAVACLPAGSRLVAMDLTAHLRGEGRAERTAEIESRLAVALREARLRDAVPCVTIPTPGEDKADRSALFRALQRLLPTCRDVVLLSSRHGGNEARAALGSLPEVRIAPPDPDRRVALWHRALDVAPGAEATLHRGLREIGYRYALSAHEIRQATEASRVLAAMRQGRLARGVPVTPSVAELHMAVRQHIEHQLGTLAEPFSTGLGWDDLVLESSLVKNLKDMVAYASNEHIVHSTWGFGRINPYGRGLTALFAGPPGTGKTLTAAIIAREIGCDLYRVDLSRIVDKYIGETEKNLARVFDEAERSKAVLLFDEADSLFAKRTDVKSSHDRYANLEVNFLLQRMEHFNGVTILTTNLSSQLDDAFQRRIKFKLTFSLPDRKMRLRLWKLMIPPEAPVDRHIDWRALAEDYEMAPGNIKNAIIAAAFGAVHREQATITEADLRAAASMEYRALGKLVRDRE